MLSFRRLLHKFSDKTLVSSGSIVTLSGQIISLESSAFRKTTDLSLSLSLPTFLIHTRPNKHHAHTLSEPLCFFSSCRSVFDTILHLLGLRRCSRVFPGNCPWTVYEQRWCRMLGYLSNYERYVARIVFRSWKATVTQAQENILFTSLGSTRDFFFLVIHFRFLYFRHRGCHDGHRFPSESLLHYHFGLGHLLHGDVLRFRSPLVSLWQWLQHWKVSFISFFQLIEQKGCFVQDATTKEQQSKRLSDCWWRWREKSRHEWAFRTKTNPRHNWKVFIFQANSWNIGWFLHNPLTAFAGVRYLSLPTTARISWRRMARWSPRVFPSRPTSPITLILSSSSGSKFHRSNAMQTSQL